MNKKRNVYVTLKQKKKLVELVAKSPDLISRRSGSQSAETIQLLWQDIAKVCNSLPGSRKTWRQWRKTWQDMRSKYSRRNDPNKPPPSLTTVLTQDEKEALGVTDSLSHSQPHGITEFVDLPPNEENSCDVTVDFEYLEEDIERESPTRSTDSIKPEKIKKRWKSKEDKYNSKHSNCNFNCDLISKQEQRKIQIKEDYYNFKKDYLRQKLKLLKEQTEALKSIAQELSDK